MTSKPNVERHPCEADFLHRGESSTGVIYSPTSQYFHIVVEQEARG